MRNVGTSLRNAWGATRGHLSVYWPLYAVVGAGALGGGAAAATQDYPYAVERGIYIGAGAAAGAVAAPVAIVGGIEAWERADRAFLRYEHRLPNWLFPKTRARRLVREADRTAGMRQSAEARRYAGRALALVENPDAHIVLGYLSDMEAQTKRDEGDSRGYRSFLRDAVRHFDVSRYDDMRPLLADTPDWGASGLRAAEERLDREKTRHTVAAEWGKKCIEAASAYEAYRGDMSQLAAALDALFCFSRYAAQDEIDELAAAAGIAPHLRFNVKVDERDYLHPTRHVYEGLQEALLRKHGEETYRLYDQWWYWNEKPHDHVLDIARGDLGSVGDDERRADLILAGEMFGRAYAATGDEHYLQDAWQRIHRASRPRGRFERDQPYSSAVQHAASVRSWLASLYHEKSERAEALARAKKPWDGSYPGYAAIQTAEERARNGDEEDAWWAGALNARAYAGTSVDEHRTAALTYAQQFAGRSVTINGKKRRFDDLARWVNSLHRKHMDNYLAGVEEMLSTWNGAMPEQHVLEAANELAASDKRTPAQLAAAVVHTRAYAAGGSTEHHDRARSYLNACTEPGAALYGKRITVSGMERWIGKIDAGRRA